MSRHVLRAPERARVRRLAGTALLLGCIAGASASADTAVDAKLQCQLLYGSGSDADAACERGVDLAARASGKLDVARRGCSRGSEERAKSDACEHGVALHARAARKSAGKDVSRFAYSWRQGGGAAQVEIGDYDVLVGDAEKSIEDCMRAFDGSKTPPSCLSGLRVQRQPPRDPYRR